MNVADPSLLDAVRAAAAAALEARVTGEGVDEAMRRTLATARAALEAGHPISAIAAAEVEGERAARGRTAAQLLRAVERAARKLVVATDEHEGAIALAVRVGLPARDIAVRAGISHGTVAAIARRQERSQGRRPAAAAAEEQAPVATEEPAPESGAG